MSQRKRKIPSLVVCLMAMTCILSMPGRCDTFEERQQTVLNSATANLNQVLNNPGNKQVWFVAQAYFVQGRIDEGLQVVRKAITWIRRQAGGNMGFSHWPAIDTYVRYNSLFDDGLKQQFRTEFTTNVDYRKGTTSNQILMNLTARYLANQIWPGELDPAGNWRANDPIGEQWLRGRIASDVVNGIEEFGSRPYGMWNMCPLESLAELSADADLANKAGIAYEVTLAQAAPTWLRGIWGLPAFRSYPDQTTQQAGGGARLLWLYFGGQVSALGSSFDGLYGAVAAYRLPDLIANAAVDRSMPYVARSRFRNLFQYSFVNLRYVLFSQAAHTFNQTYPDGVMWEESNGGRYDFLWAAVPASDTPATVNKEHTHGISSGYVQSLQNEGTSVLVANVSPNYTYPYVLGYVPGGYQAVIDESSTAGRIFLSYNDNVLIAISATQPFGWDPNAGIFAPSSAPRSGDSEFRVSGPQVGLVFETGLPEEFLGNTPNERLQSFREVILAQGGPTLIPDVNPTVIYADRFGNTLEKTFKGTAKINGTVVNYSGQSPYLDNPWMSEPYPDRKRLTITDGTRVRTYDFTNWTVMEQ